MSCVVCGRPEPGLCDLCTRDFQRRGNDTTNDVIAWAATRARNFERRRTDIARVPRDAALRLRDFVSSVLSGADDVAPSVRSALTALRKATR